MSTNDHKRGRREPTLGDLDHLHTPAPTPAPKAAGEDLPRVKADRGGKPPAPPRRTRKPAHRMPSPWRSWLWPVLAVVIVVLLALAWINQDRLRAMLPRTHLNTMLVDADQALAAGRLEGANGTSAHELYAGVLRQEPDNGHARRGLRKVGRAELARASSAIKAGDYRQAEVWIANASRLLGGGAEVDKVSAALEKAKHPTKRIHATLEKAQQALAAGRVAGSDGATALYHQVLRVDPDNAVARHGLERAGDMLATRARTALRQGDVATAASLVDQLGKLLPRDGDLPALRARLSQARQATDAAISSHLDKGQTYLHEGRFTGHGGDNALTQFQAVLKLDADNAQAKAGLQQVARALVLRANAAIEGHAIAQARELLDKAAELAPKSLELAAARARLQSLPDAPSLPQAQTATASTFVHPTLKPLQQVEVKQLLQRARSAASAGHIMLPPGDSAYDLYREVLTIDANNVAARDGLNALSSQVVTLFNQALATHRLRNADEYLATLQSLDPASTRADGMSRRLADAWLDRAQRDVDQGNRVAAMQALDAARKLDPDPARVKAIRQRLHDG